MHRSDGQHAGEAGLLTFPCRYGQHHSSKQQEQNNQHKDFKILIVNSEEAGESRIRKPQRVVPRRCQLLGRNNIAMQ